MSSYSEVSVSPGVRLRLNTAWGAVSLCAEEEYGVNEGSAELFLDADGLWRLAEQALVYRTRLLGAE